jgi:GAF domain-containing protein
MTSPENLAQEQARLTTLWSTNLLDSPPNACIDRITRLVQQYFQVPIAAVTMVDKDRVWFKSCLGLPYTEAPRTGSFCNHALEGGDFFVVNDAEKHPVFAGNTLVTGEVGIRFYAGQPLRAPDGHIVGFLCLLDQAPRAFTQAEVQTLADFAALVENELFVTVLNRTLAENHRRELDRLHRLLATMRDAAQTPLDLAAVIQLILEHAGEITGASGAVLAVHEGTDMVYRFAAGLAAPHVGLRLPFEASLPGLCVRTQETLIANDTECDPRVVRETCRRLGARSLLLVPLKAPGFPDAALGVISDRPNAFTPFDVQTLG